MDCRIPPQACSNLPSSLFDVYLRYKQGTRAIVAWLVKTGSLTGPRNSHQGYSIKDLQAFAQVACRKAEPLPDLIAFHFRETISARRRLSQHFRKASCAAEETNDLDTENHEHFTASLTEIYTKLCKCCHDNGQEKCDHTRGAIGRRHHSPSGCRYTVLERSEGHAEAVEDAALNNQEHSAVEEEQCQNSTSYWHEALPSSSTTSDIQGDLLHDWVEMARFSKDLEVALCTVRTSWQRAARQEIPLALAAFTTNTVFTSLKAREAQLQLLLSNFSVNNWTLDTGNSHDSCCGSETTPVATVHETFRHLEGIKARVASGSGAVIEDVESNSLQTPTYKKTSEYLCKDGKQTSEQELHCVSTLFNAIATLSASSKQSSVVTYGTPLAGDVYLYGRAKDKDAQSLGLSSAIGMQLIMRSFEAYLWPDRETRNIECVPRLQALRFAQEVRKSIELVLADRTMPCRCCMTLASNLENFQNDMDTFMKERYFDLFVQSSWISGSHMLEILETAFNYSMRLCSYKHYFGSVLHLYNCLHALGQASTVPFLEELCKVFQTIVFPGERPNVGFRSSYLRLKGGRLKQAHSKHKQWHLAVPRHEAREAAGFGTPREPIDSSFRYKKTSLLHSIKTKGYQIDRGAEQMIDARQFNKTNESRGLLHSRSPCSVCNSSDPDRLLELEETLAATELVPSSMNPLPIGRVNYFKLYLACVRALASISNECHEEQPTGGYCICFVEDLLKRADAVGEIEKTGKREPFGHKKVIGLCNDAFKKEFDIGKEKWRDFLWEHL